MSAQLDKSLDHTEDRVPGMTVCMHVRCRVPVHSISLGAGWSRGQSMGLEGTGLDFIWGRRKAWLPKDLTTLTGHLISHL